MDGVSARFCPGGASELEEVVLPGAAAQHYFYRLYNQACDSYEFQGLWQMSTRQQAQEILKTWRIVLGDVAQHLVLNHFQG